VKADVTVNVYIETGNTTTLVDTFSGSDLNGADSGAVTLTDGKTTFTGVHITASSNAPGDPTAGGLLFQQSVETRASSGSGKLIIQVSETTPFSQPPGPAQMVIDSSISQSKSLSSTAAPVTFQSFVNGITPAGLGVQVLNAFGEVDKSVLFSEPNSTYTLGNTMTIGAGGSFNVTGSESVLANPEPSTLAVAVTGSVLAIGMRRRFRTRRERV
jgi:hypothetical protein